MLKCNNIHFFFDYFGAQGPDHNWNLQVPSGSTYVAGHNLEIPNQFSSGLNQLSTD